MHTLHLKHFIDEHHLYENLNKLNVDILKIYHGLLVKLHWLLAKFNVKTLEETFQRESVSDVLVLTSLFFMVLFIVKTYLKIMLWF